MCKQQHEDLKGGSTLRCRRQVIILVNLTKFLLFGGSSSFFSLFVLSFLFFKMGSLYFCGIHSVDLVGLKVTELHLPLPPEW